MPAAVISKAMPRQVDGSPSNSRTLGFICTPFEYGGAYNTEGIAPVSFGPMNGAPADGIHGTESAGIE